MQDCVSEMAVAVALVKYMYAKFIHPH